MDSTPSASDSDDVQNESSGNSDSSNLPISTCRILYEPLVKNERYLLKIEQVFSRIPNAPNENVDPPTNITFVVKDDPTYEFLSRCVISSMRLNRIAPDM